MKTPINPEVRQQVLNLRRNHSFREVANLTSLSIGTVKTICSRSGEFRDNQLLRSVFTLPPMKQGVSTALATPELPPQREVTGDIEIDAVLWLREVIKTGQPDLIEKAMLGAKRIQTPLKELEDRYQKHLNTVHPGDFRTIFATLGFADLEGLARASIKKATLQHEATSRFGDTLLKETPAEKFCIDSLVNLTPDNMGFLDDDQVDEVFNSPPDMKPNTLSDCLYELAYWHDLYCLRNAYGWDERSHEAYAREEFAFRCLSRIRPRSKEEAISVFRYLAKADRSDKKETDAILLNLMR